MNAIKNIKGDFYLMKTYQSSPAIYKLSREI